MNGLPYYPRYPRDLIEGTIGMPFELKLTYGFLLDLIYMQGGDLPDDPRYISGVLGCSVRKWKALRAELLDSGKIHVADGSIRNYRAIIELEKSAKYQDKQRENASGPRKNKGLQKPAPSHTDTDTYKKGEANASPKKKRGSRLPEDWVLPASWGRWALDEGWSEPAIRQQAEIFKDFWLSVPGQRGVKLDWERTWRNWMRKSTAPKLINGGGNARLGKTEQTMDAFLAGARSTS